MMKNKSRTKKIIAMIPARLGSKRIKNKNLRLLDGKPLVCHVIDKAKDAKVFDDIYVNSESDIFADLCQEYGIKFYKRSAALAGDDATNDMFVLDFINHVSCDIIIQINPTSPLISVKDIKGFVKTMLEGNYDTLHSVKQEQIEALFKENALNFDPLGKMPKSQDLEPVMLFSSGIMGWQVDKYHENIKKYKAATYGGDGKTGYFILNGYSNIDIDNEEDFLMAELAIAFQKNPAMLKPRYYEPKKEKLRAETDVFDILIRDGVEKNDLDDANKPLVNLKEIINSQDNTKSWSIRIINTENNSATLISQLPGEGNRLHHHNNWNEWWYIVSGEWEWEIEGKKILVKEGDVVFIQKNMWHKITAAGKKPAVRLAISKDKVPHIYKEDEDAQK
ncbi:MAG: cupin domain-containing protein [Candidatus Margulisbacteria bacterium]|nr:cupin domain-containing protein [Candidatus Margulisiibacteriota bacterium]MBU1021529.1 cupin domain-containing protein [Candidatus Margulisiibacteriota bacterium]MBU1728614.1 cupin domain-containing protein [Candidatus Margulisiibacteriota bacterium]MBU1955807.1 cupin domain-containing protein [Candidatus Margulisiibacteriota bacterium]